MIESLDLSPEPPELDPARSAPESTAARRVRALLICSEQPPVESGVARAIASVSAGLRDRGHTVDLLTGADGRYFTVGEFRFNTLAVHWRDVRATLDEYDVVNVHGPAPTISDAYLALLRAVRASRRPRILYTHHFSIDLDQWRRASQLYDWFHRRVARLADEIVVSSPSYQEMLSSRRGPPVRMIPWGVDLERFSGERLVAPYDGSRPLRVLFVGQMRPYKGIAETIEAVAGQPGLELTLVGKGRLDAHFRSLAAGTNIRFLGPMSDASLTRVYRSHDLIVKASTNRLEAFGLVLVEGMAAGCIPVASDLPGVRDVAAPTGRIVPVGDAEGLRRTLLELAANPSVVRELQERSQAEARRYGWERTVDSYERAFLNPVPKVIDLTQAGPSAEAPVPSSRRSVHPTATDTRVKVLYIGGTGRTGSTLIESILGQFDQVFNGGELAFLWRYGLREGGRCSCGRLLVECSTWTTILDEAYGGIDVLDADEMVRLRKRFNSKHLPLMLTPRLRSRLLRRSLPFPERVEQLYRAIRAATGSSLIVDSSKEPHYSYILKSRPNLDLYFLHLVRDPRAIAFSWRRKRTERGFGDAAFMDRRGWIKSAAYFDVSNLAAERIWGRESGRYLRLRYEDFVASPRDTLQEIGSFVGENFEVDRIVADEQFVLQPTHSAWGNPNRFECGKTRIDLDTAWANGLPAWRRLAATSMTWPFMRRYGYPIRSVPVESRPEPRPLHSVAAAR